MRAIIPTIVTQLLKDKQISLGNLEPVRDFNYVKDTVQAFLAVSECDALIGETVNIGCGVGWSIDTLVQKICEITNISVPVAKDRQRIRPDSSEVSQLVCDSRKAQALLGWKSSIGFEEALGETIQWFRDHVGQYEHNVYGV